MRWTMSVNKATRHVTLIMLMYIESHADHIRGLLTTRRSTWLTLEPWDGTLMDEFWGYIVIVRIGFAACIASAVRSGTRWHTRKGLEACERPWCKWEDQSAASLLNVYFEFREWCSWDVHHTSLYQVSSIKWRLCQSLKNSRTLWSITSPRFSGQV